MCHFKQQDGAIYFKKSHFDLNIKNCIENTLPWKEQSITPARICFWTPLSSMGLYCKKKCLWQSMSSGTSPGSPGKWLCTVFRFFNLSLYNMGMPIYILQLNTFETSYSIQHFAFWQTLKHIPRLTSILRVHLLHNWEIIRRNGFAKITKLLHVIPIFYLFLQIFLLHSSFWQKNVKEPRHNASLGGKVYSVDQ